MIRETRTPQLLNTIKEQLNYKKNQSIYLEQNIFPSNGIILESIAIKSNQR